jgi:hypothetical protein
MFQRMVRTPFDKKQRPASGPFVRLFNIQPGTAASALGNTGAGWQPERRPIPYAGNNGDVHTIGDTHASYATDGYAAQSLLENDVGRSIEADEQSAPSHKAGNA